MGNYRFRFSDMIPNAWFYRLKDMNRTRNHSTTTTPPTTKKKNQPTPSSLATVAAAGQPSGPRQPHLSEQRKSYYFTRDLIPPPSHESHDKTEGPDLSRKSSKKKRNSTKRNRVVSDRSSPRVLSSSVSAGCSCGATLESIWTKPDSTSEEYPHSPPESSSEHDSLFPELDSDRGGILDADATPQTFDGMISWSASCRCRVDNDIIIDMDCKPFNPKFEDGLDGKLVGFDTVSEKTEIELPPIITKPARFTVVELDMKKTETQHLKETIKCKRNSAKIEERNARGSSVSAKIETSKEQRTGPARRSSVHSPGLKLRTNSPRIMASRRIQGRKPSAVSSSSRRTLSESCAVVKSSADPQRDFRDSMVEMIVENNIRASKDLEDLLACYLSLNSDEYHDLIIKVFKQIWFDLIVTRLA